jgi:hypothetical protein
MERVKLIQTTEIQLTLTPLQAAQLQALLLVTSGSTDDVVGLYGELNDVMNDLGIDIMTVPDFVVNRTEGDDDNDHRVTINELSLVARID